MQVDARNLKLFFLPQIPDEIPDAVRPEIFEASALWQIAVKFFERLPVGFDRARRESPLLGDVFEKKSEEL